MLSNQAQLSSYKLKDSLSLYLYTISTVHVDFKLNLMAVIKS